MHENFLEVSEYLCELLYVYLSLFSVLFESSFLIFSIFARNRIIRVDIKKRSEEIDLLYQKENFFSDYTSLCKIYF